MVKKKRTKNTQAFLEKEKAMDGNFRLLPGSSPGMVLGRAEAPWLACTHTYLSTWMFSQSRDSHVYKATLLQLSPGGSQRPSDHAHREH